MPSGLALAPLARPGGAGSGGHGFYDLRSWLVTLGILALLVGFGWLLRRPVRRRRQNNPRPITNKPTPASPAPRDSPRDSTRTADRTRRRRRRLPDAPRAAPAASGRARQWTTILPRRLGSGAVADGLGRLHNSS